MNTRLTIAATAFAVLLALGACGRKGELEPPPNISPDMASAQSPACANKADTGQEPIDAIAGGGVTTGNPNRMPVVTTPGC